MSGLALTSVLTSNSTHGSLSSGLRAVTYKVMQHRLDQLIDTTPGLAILDLHYVNYDIVIL